MNDKTREQIEAMKMQTIGVEVEMNNITREKAARKVAEFFGTTAWYAAGEYGYMSWACKDQQGRVWKFQRDISIHGPEAEKCEMVTPILTYEDIETLQAIIRLLRKAGAKSSPSRGCGVHIHIGKGRLCPFYMKWRIKTMAVTKKIEIDGQMVEFRASAAVPRLYRIKFGRDIYKDLRSLEKSVGDNDEESSSLDLFSLEMFENIAYIMAKHAHPDQVPDTPDEWLENFNTFSIYQILPQLIELWGLNVQTEVEARKNLAKVSG